MEFIKTINLPEKTSDNKDLPKKKVNKKKNNKEIKIEKQILYISFKHDSIVQEMEFQKIVNFLDTTSDKKNLPKFVTKKWIEVYDQSQENYNVNKEIRIKTSMLRSDLRDFSDAYIAVKGNITATKKTFTADDIDALNNTAANVTAANTANNNAFGDKKLVFKNNAPFINCISNINGVKIDNAEHLDVVMPMYNLLEYSKNYRKTTGTLWNYYRDEPSSTIGAKNITHSILNSESFDYKVSFMENGVTHDNLTKNDKVVVPLKHLGNFWRHLDIPLINCEVKLILTWFKNCVLIDKSTRDADYDADPNVYEIDSPENAIFKITDTKLYVPAVTLSKEDDIKLLKQLKSGFKRTINWNKYRSQMIIQPQNNNFNYLLDPTFTKVNRLFVLSFPRNNNTDCRYSFSNYYAPKVKVNDFNVLIDGKSFFDLSVKNDEKAYEKIIDMSNNSDYTTGNLLDYAYYKKHYRLNAIDLSKQTKLKDPQPINFIGKLLRHTGATMFFIIEKSEETTFNFSHNSVTIV